MRIEIAGAQVTDAVVEVLEALQTDRQLIEHYIRVLDDVTRMMIYSDEDDVADTEKLNNLRALQMIRRDILALSSPPDVDNEANDTAIASF